MVDKLDDRHIDDSTVEKEQNSRTLVDYYDMQKQATSSFDLDVTTYRDAIADLMIQQVGVKVSIDGTTEHIMLADLDRIYTNLQGNMKDVTYLFATTAKRGSRVDFPNGAIGMVWSIPDDDIVAKSSKMLIFNSNVQFFRRMSGYDEDVNSPTYGDAIENTLLDMKLSPCFVERIDGEIRAHDVGILQESILRMFTFQSEVKKDPEIKIGDVAMIDGAYYDVGDVDNFTSGITRIQLKNSRTAYDEWKVQTRS